MGEDKRIKIAHIGQPHTGVGTYIRSIIRNVNQSDFESFLISDLKSSEEFGEVQIASSNTFYVPFSREINPLKDINSLKKAIEALRIIDPDIIHAHSSKCGFIGRLAGWITGIPVLYTPNAFSYLSTDSKIKSLVYRFIERLGKGTGAKLLACSKSEAERGVNDLGYNYKDVLIWNNSIEDIPNSSIKSRFLDFRQYICSIGRPSYQKNLQMLIDVFYEVRKIEKDLKLVIIGGGSYSPEKDQLIERIHKLDLDESVIIFDHLKREDTLSILNESTLYAMTSRYEGLPFSVIEALCLGVPCVLTNVDGNRDCVDDDINGFLIDDYNEEDMKMRMISLLKSNELRIRMSLSSRKMFEDRFEISTNILNLERIYRNYSKNE